MSKINIKSPAKINLHLTILRKLKNGFHELDTSFQLIDLYDEISFKKVERGISIKCDNKNICDHNNIVFQVARDLQQNTKNNGIEIEIKKNIPIGSGLGGASSNAGSAIIMLNKIWQLNLNKNKLIKYASKVGADVPFFIFGKNAYATGIGEKLKYKKSINSNLIIIDPKIHNSTKQMFNLYDKNTKNEYKELYFKQNSFWSVYLENEKKVRDFYNSNFREFKLNLSGSGSCMYVAYDKKKEIEELIKKIPSNWRFFLCKPLQYSPISYL